MQDLWTSPAEPLGEGAVSDCGGDCGGLWSIFKTDFKKGYETVEEEIARLKFVTFKENVAFISAHNAKSEEHGYTVGMNQFGDMSSKEFKKVMLTLVEYCTKLRPPQPSSTAHNVSDGGK